MKELITNINNKGTHVEVITDKGSYTFHTSDTLLPLMKTGRYIEDSITGKNTGSMAIYSENGKELDRKGRFHLNL